VEQVARRAEPPFLRADPAAFRTGDYDMVTSSNDVVRPERIGQSVSPEGVVFAPMEPVVQKVQRRRR
jgi:hypothetical protein